MSTVRGLTISHHKHVAAGLLIGATGRRRRVYGANPFARERGEEAVSAISPSTAQEQGGTPGPNDVLDVVIVGAGQAGLALGRHLQQQRLRFVLLEAGHEVGHVWRSRWE